MYSTCLFCRSTLGKNRVLEQMPVGRRLAYDPAKGRLWAVCPRCGRWNLCPFEERWETLEDCERLARKALLRESTGAIALLEHRSGLSLIRVGTPAFEELVSWRFARSLVRRRRGFTATGVVLGAAGATTLLGLATGGGASVSLLGMLVGSHAIMAMLRPAIDLTTSDGVKLRITEPAARGVAFGVDVGTGPILRVTTRDAEVHDVTGTDIALLLARAMPYVNDTGGTAELAVAAAATISEKGGPEGFLADIAGDRGLHKAAVLWPTSKTRRREGAVLRLPQSIRLALEAASHVHQEELVLSGELRGVLEEWRAAEELAEISDSLVDPPGWASFKSRHQGPIDSA
jgi:hypothetical protein